MSIYFESINTAFIIFLFLGFLLFIPWLIYSYRKYGYLSVWESVVMYSFVFYMLTALFLVLLPLPTTRDTCSLQPPDTVHYSLVPLSFIKDIMSSSSVVWSHPSTYGRLLTESAFFQAVFNFLLLMPFGVYLRYFFNHRGFWKKALGLGFSLSLFYEITQITGIYGIYNCPYRIFDVDDLLLNSTGALIGFLLAPILLALFPSRKSVEAKGEELQKVKYVSPLSQLVAIMTDYLVIKLSWTFTLGLFIMDGFIEFIYTTIGFFIIFFLIPYIWNGKTIGTGIMRFKLATTKDNQCFWKSLLIRTFALYLPFMLSRFLKMVVNMEIDMDSILYPYHVWGSMAIIIFLVMMWITLFFHVVFVLMRRKQRSYYFDYVANLIPKKE
ncbi:MAG TPA: VanZ family protein [Candidatus Dormibacteraeota bacterium]|nr:VanZ family protein [Candidatus Dormibacteraeota bacterium]